MEQQTKQLYEGMFVFGAHLGEESRKSAFEKIKVMLEEHGAEIHKIHEQGRRRLAYEIRRHREGYYYVVYFSMDQGNGHMEELWEEWRRNEDLLRFLTLKTDKVLEEIRFKQLPEQ